MFSRTFLAAESRHLLFCKKKGWFFPQRKSRKTKLDLLYFLTQKFLPAFLQKERLVFSAKKKQKNQA